MTDTIPLAAVVPAWLTTEALETVIAASERIVATGVQLLFLGQTEKSRQSEIDKIAAKHKEAIAVEKRTSDSAIHQAIAGSDLLLLPNGSGRGNNLGQLYALKYGTLPLVIHSVLPAKSSVNASLLQIDEPSADNIVEIIAKSVQIFKQTSQWQQLVSSAMKGDFSWDDAIEGYIKSYQRVAGKKK